MDSTFVTSIDPKDVQGVVRFGYAAMTEACYLLVRIRDAAAARAWCGTAPVTTAELLPHVPETAVQVAFSSSGLSALGLPAAVLAGFSAEFQSGMAGEDNRSRRLGDVGPSAPGNWFWGGPQNRVDAVIMLFANPGKLEGWRTTIENDALRHAFELIRCLPTSDLGGHEQFGFKDGVSQPQIDWDTTLDVNREEITYRNLIAAGEFLLGYPNEYGKYTDRPLIDAGDRGAADLLPAEDTPTKKDLGRNGTYVAMRTLEQDVRGFWKFLDGQSKSGPEARQRLGEIMVGRTLDGDPLVPASAVPIEGISSKPKDDQNRFTFDHDPVGTKCPFGAHIRRANPRDTDYPNRPSWFLTRWFTMLGFASKELRSDIMASTRFHRVLRRGREYGPRLTPDDAVMSQPVDDPERGLQFLCFNANIKRQFEFVQNAWIMSTKFDGMSGESDALLGNRTQIGDGRPTDNFTIPRDAGVRRCVTGLPQFVTVRGGEYFFLPGIRALRYFSRMGE